MATVRFFAAARAAAGVAEQTIEADTLAEALRVVRQDRDDRFGAILDVCSFLVDGAPAGTRAHEAVQLSEHGVIDCLPPFAGG